MSAREPSGRTWGIYPASVFFFAALGVAAVVGFWAKYFSMLREAAPFAHAHGIAMSFWIVLLVIQAYLMRTGRRGLHRQVGQMSYALVPVIVVATALFAHEGLNRTGLTGPRLLLFYLQAHLLFLFALSWGLAIYNRKTPVVHARFMICTALTLIDPIFARIIGRYIWTPPEPVYVQMITYSMTDLVLVALIASNWRREWRLRVYPAMLAAFVPLQLPTFYVVGMPAWTAFAAWYMALPLT
jgi:hypothetical protein